MHLTTVLLIALSAMNLENSWIDPEKFRDDYARDFETISQQLQNVKGNFLLTISTKNKAGKVLKSAQDSGTFDITGGLGKCVRDVKRTSGKQTKEMQLVHGMTHDTCFTLSRKKGESEYTLDNYSPLPKPGEIPKGPVEFRIFCGSFWTAPYLFMSSDWRKALRENENRKVLIENAELDGKKIVKIVIQYVSNPGRTTEFELDPSLNHRILRSAMVMDGRPEFQYQVEYQEGSVIPKQVIYTGPSEEIRCDFLDLKFVPTQAEEFQLAYFGISNIETGTGSGSFYVYWAIFGVILCVLVYIFTSRRSVRFLKTA